MKLGRKCKLQWHLHLVHTIHPKIYGKDSLLRTSSLSRKLTVKSNVYGDETFTSEARDKVSGFQHFDCSHSSLNYSFKCLNETVQCHNLVFNYQTGIPPCWSVYMLIKNYK